MTTYRGLLSGLLSGALLLLVGCTSPESNDQSEPEPADEQEQMQAASWSYSGETGPAQWASLDSAYAACAGDRQSPIDLPAAGDASEGMLEMSYDEAGGQLVDAGKVVQIDHTGGTLTVDGTPYNLVQFHFHTPSEHTVTGNAFPAEVHFVHAADDGMLAVIGVMIEEGEASSALAPFWDDLSAMEDAPVEDIDVDELLPEEQSYYTYPGSLTTPPCSENVTWIVMQTPITMSAEQLDALRAVYDDNARPVQPLNDREIAVRTP